MTRWMWIAGGSALIASCAIDDPTLGKSESSQPLVITAGTRIDFEGVLDYGGVVFAENPTTLLEPKDFHGYEFAGRAGGVITITMQSNNCNQLDTFLDLFGPEDESGDRGRHLIENDDAGIGSCFFDSQIRNFRLPVTGDYLIVATSFEQRGSANSHYRLSLTCNNGACAPPDSPTFATTRIAQADIDRGLFTASELFDIGDFLFETVYEVGDGMGNALTAAPANTTPRPNFRPFPNNVHFAAFGAPEAQSCITCHNGAGLDDGAGDNNHNIFQIGDGINRNSGVPRSPPMVIGLGYREAIGKEMTAELQAQRTAALARARATGVAQTQALTSKGVSFGSLIANVNQTVNTAGVEGVDPDLIIRPLGLKGREATIRRFIEGGFRVHFGLQTQPSINNHCANPNVNTFGNGANCQDPDADGVVEEISDGQLSAEAVYMALREVPVRVPAPSAALARRAVEGEALFDSASVGCAGCHTPVMRLNNPTLVMPGDTTGGAGITLKFATDGKEPRPTVRASDGSMAVVLWSDFKRHNMGAGLADSKPFNQIGAEAFVTPPLWGLGTTGPYLHDGRAPTIHDAILLHGGEGQTSRNAYAALSADNQLKIQEFLVTLGRQENIDAQTAPVDFTDFALEQTSSAIRVFFGNVQVPHGGVMVIARNATRAQFQTFYGRTLDTNVVFINAFGQFPAINGSETFSLFDSNGVLVDGPTIPQPAAAGRTFSRRSCGTVSNQAASWTSNTAVVANASPGTAAPSAFLNRICISEFADATSSNFEYIEIQVE